MECRGQDGQSRETFWNRATVQLEAEEDVCAARSENSESSAVKRPQYMQSDCADM